MSYAVGMDVGSTTLKVLVLDDANKIVYKSYERHKSLVREMAFAKIEELSNLFANHDLHFAISGSAGIGIANEGGFAFVQEVFATAGAVKRYYPKTDVVIELGGEDAKIIFLKGALEERMNSTCAGGTGAFIDQMASLLAVDLAQMDEASLTYQELYPIASRCGVFAKSDIQPLLNQGVAMNNLAASIYQAVVDQCIAGLAQGRPIEGNVLFLGGPLSFLKGLQLRFKETLHLSSDQATFPELAPYFVALGVALYARNEKTISYAQLHHQFQAILHQEVQTTGLPPLFQNDEEYLAFKDRHKQAMIPHKDLATYQGKAYIGIDAGSTTTKLVMIDEDDNILYESYTSNLGNPVEVIRKQLLNIYETMEYPIDIVQCGVTGYGEDLVKHAFHLDFGVVETIAHYQAACHFNPDVDFIIDIGGQDMKCFRIKDHCIDDIILNEACSSGCGSFIETFSKSMGYTIEEFAQMGLAGEHPVDLGTRCTVFMNSSVKQAQKNGAKIEDIAAGLCISVVKNALYKVIRAKSIDDLGKQIVVQGGTFLNDTILRSFESELHCHVIRPGIAHLMGAYGTALLAKQKTNKHSDILTYDQLQLFTHKSLASQCGLCTNHCKLTINTFSDGQKHIAGNRCERPLHGAKDTQPLPNLYNFKYEYLYQYPSKKGTRGKIGIPMVLNFYDTLPFWCTFFEALDYEVVLSPKSSRVMYGKSQHTIPSDTICYPAKLVHGHIQALIEQNVDMIFYPCMSYNFDEHLGENHYQCPVVAYYPEVVQANMDLKQTKFIYPYVYLQDPKNFKKQIHIQLEQANIHLDQQDITMASDAAYKALQNYRDVIKKTGRQALLYAQEHHKDVLVLAGRPYHIDPLVHHGLHQLINDLDFVLLSEDALPTLPYHHLHVLNQWTFHARMFNAARYVSEHPHMELIQLVSFGCGIDSITGDEMKDILRSKNKLYTQLKIDEIDNLGAIKIRIRSLKAAMEERSLG